MHHQNDRMKYTIFILTLLSFLSCRTTKTYREIETIQKSYIEKLYGNEIPSFLNPDTLKKAFQDVDKWFEREQGEKFISEEDSKEILKQISKLNPPTKYQDIGTYFLLYNLIKKINTTNNKIKLYKRTENPLYATLWTNEINAESRKVNGQYVLFFNKRLFDFCLTMSKLALKPVQFNAEGNDMMSLTTDIDTLIERLIQDKELQERFVYALLEFHYNVAPDPFLLDNNHNPLVINLINSMELFVLSHEYTHAALKHDLKGKFQALGETYSTKEDTLTLKKRLVESWQNEILADIYGQIVINNHSIIENNYYLKDFNKVGGFFFLQCADILDKSLYILQNKKEKTSSITDSVTTNEILNNLFANMDSIKINYDKIDASWLSTLHPPNEIRELFILNILQKNINKEMLNNNITNEQYGFYNLAINMTLVIEKLYEITKDKLLLLANNEQLLKQINNEQ